MAWEFLSRIGYAFKRTDLDPAAWISILDLVGRGSCADDISLRGDQENGGRRDAAGGTSILDRIVRQDSVFSQLGVAEA